MRKVRTRRHIRSTVLAAFGVLSLAVCTVASESSEENGLVILSCYESPTGVYHALLQNSTAEVMTISPTSVRRGSDNKSLETWWTRVEPKEVKPGQWTHFCFKTKMVEESVETVNAGFDVFNRTLTLGMSPREPELDITYAVHDSAHGKFYLYLRNNTESILSVRSIAVNEYTLRDLGPTQPVELSPREKGIVFGHLDGLAVPTGGALPAHVEIVTQERTLHRFAYVFSSEQFQVGREGSSELLMSCPTHKHGTFEQAAAKLYELADAAEVNPRSIHICRRRPKEGLRVFGQCVERAVFNLQGSNQTRGKQGWLEGLLDIASLCKTCTEPGVFAALIESGSSLPGSRLGATMAGREARVVVYGEVACGAKGFGFRLNPGPTTDGDSRSYFGMVEFIERELRTILSFLAISEPVDLVTNCSSDRVIPRTLLCGDRGVVLIVLREDLRSRELPRQVDIVLSTPAWLRLSEFIEIGGQRARGTLLQHEDGVKLTVEELDSVRVYLLPSLLGEMVLQGS